jgi:hypothetical protein
MKPASLASVLAVLCCSLPALAAEAEPEWDGDYKTVATRRSDFSFGASAGLMAGTAYGYPNEADAIGNPARVGDTGIGAGSAFELWLGGALRDWFNFGLGVTGFGFEATDGTLEGGGFVVRVEFFPFFGQGKALDDVGAFGSFGLGGATISEGDEQRADGGAVSIIGLGAFWEPWRFGSFAAGPSIEYRHVFSRTLTLYGATAGIRLAFYAGP